MCANSANVQGEETALHLQRIYMLALVSKKLDIGAPASSPTVPLKVIRYTQTKIKGLIIAAIISQDP
jgi:hypothetical protein